VSNSFDPEVTRCLIRMLLAYGTIVVLGGLGVKTVIKNEAFAPEEQTYTDASFSMILVFFS